VYKYKLTFYSSKSFFLFLLYTEQKSTTYHLLLTVRIIINIFCVYGSPRDNPSNILFLDIWNFSNFSKVCLEPKNRIDDDVCLEDTYIYVSSSKSARLALRNVEACGQCALSSGVLRERRGEGRGAAGRAALSNVSKAYGGGTLCAWTAALSHTAANIVSKAYGGSSFPHGGDYCQ
jgi:hypothetical protein